jgi:hypothetical protein
LQASLSLSTASANSVLADKSSLRRGKPGGGGILVGCETDLATQSSLRRGKPGGGVMLGGSETDLAAQSSLRRDEPGGGEALTRSGRILYSDAFQFAGGLERTEASWRAKRLPSDF